MSAPLSWRITRALHPDGGRVWVVYDTAAYDLAGGSACGPFANDPSVRFTADTEAECQGFLDIAGTSEDLIRAIAEGSGSLSIAAIAEERARIREQIQQARGK